MPKPSNGASAPIVAPALKLATITPIHKKYARLSADALECVVELKRLLKEAERGELRGIAYIALYQGTDYGWDHDTVALAKSNPLNLISMLEVVKHRALLELEKNS